MSKLRTALFTGLASALFSISIACSGQPQPYPTPTPVVSRVDVSSPSGVTNSIKNYKPSERELKTAEAVRYLISVEDRQTIESYVLETYGKDIGSSAIAFVKLAESNKEDIVLRAVSGDPYTLEALKQKMGNPTDYVLASLVDYTFNNVFMYDIDADEMKQFEDVADSYAEFKKETGFGTETPEGIDPNFKAFVVYSVNFTVRSYYQDPLTAHRYAWAIARNPKTRDASFDFIYDIYYLGKEGAENLRAQLKDKDINPESLKQKANEVLTATEEKAREKVKEVEQPIPEIKKELEEKTKQQAEELKRKAEEELKRKQQELQQQQEKAKQQAEELKRKAEEETRRKADELKRQAEEQGRKLEQEAEKAKKTICENLPKFVPKPEACK